MSRWTLLLVGLIATLALLAAACGTAEEDDEETPAAGGAHRDTAGDYRELANGGSR